MCQQNHKQTLKDSRSYSNTNTNSDHRIVVTEIEIELFKLYNRKVKSNVSKPYDCQQLQIEDIQAQYKNTLSEAMTGIDLDWKITQEKIHYVHYVSTKS